MANAVAQRLTGTQGITGLFFLRALIEEKVWHLDVDSSRPREEVLTKG